MKIDLNLEIERDDLKIDAGTFNRKMLVLAQQLHVKFMDDVVKLYKENAESVDLDTLPKAALPRWK